MCGPGCVDAVFDKLQSKVSWKPHAPQRATERPAGLTCARAVLQIGPDVPCDQSLAQCTNSITGPFLAANGNLQALLGCNRGDIAARLQPKIQCKGTKPTLDQVKAQVSG